MCVCVCLWFFDCYVYFSSILLFIFWLKLSWPSGRRPFCGGVRGGCSPPGELFQWSTVRARHCGICFSVLVWFGWRNKLSNTLYIYIYIHIWIGSKPYFKPIKIGRKICKTEFFECSLFIFLLWACSFTYHLPKEDGVLKLVELHLKNIDTNQVFSYIKNSFDPKKINLH